jgi:hypothetical protein
MKSEEKKKVPLLVGKAKTSAGAVNLIEERKQLQSDYMWISEERVSLQKTFANKYVAVKNKKVIVAEGDVYSLMGALKKKGLRADKVAVEFLAEHPVCFLL